jgi:hypothetical protein
LFVGEESNRRSPVDAQEVASWREERSSEKLISWSFLDLDLDWRNKNAIRLFPDQRRSREEERNKNSRIESFAGNRLKIKEIYTGIAKKSSIISEIGAG